MDISFIRTDSSNEDFQRLIRFLDQDLASRYGAKQEFFDQFNKVDLIRNVVVASNADGALGCGAFKKFSSSEVEIKRMFVAPEFRGRGVAREILSALEHWASELGYSTAILETGKLQHEAIRLYAKLGYSITKNFGPYVGVDLSVCMRKNLK